MDATVGTGSTCGRPALIGRRSGLDDCGATVAIQNRPAWPPSRERTYESASGLAALVRSQRRYASMKPSRSPSSTDVDVADLVARSGGP